MKYFTFQICKETIGFLKGFLVFGIIYIRRGKGFNLKIIEWSTVFRMFNLYSMYRFKEKNEKISRLAITLFGFRIIDYIKREE